MWAGRKSSTHWKVVKTMKKFLLLAIHVVSLFSSKCSGYAAIRPVPCSNSNTGENGVCTFNWSCVNIANGVHIGPCVDRFFVGSCCKIPPQDAQTREEIRRFPYHQPQMYPAATTSQETPWEQGEKVPLHNSTLKASHPFSISQNIAPRNPDILSIDRDSTVVHDVRRPVLPHPFNNDRKPIRNNPLHNLRRPVSLNKDHNKRLPVPDDHLHNLRRPVSINEDHDKRRPVPNDSVHNLRRPVSLNEDHDKGSPVLDDPSHNQRKPLISDGSEMDLRWPVLEEDSHDSRFPVSNWFHQAMNILLQLKPIPTEKINQNQTSLENSKNFTTIILPDVDFPIHPTQSSAFLENDPTTSEDHYEICGLSLGVGTTGRIVGGRKSDFQRWPWAISLRRLEGKYFKHKCGAVLLNRLWVITAAHCIDGKRDSELQLRFAYFETPVKEMVIHPNFDPITYESDLALLRLHEPLRLGPNVRPVCLPPPQMPDITGRWAVVTGWGRLSEEGELPTSLHEVLLPVLNNAECEEMYAQAGYRETIRDIFVCAGVSSGGIDACEGDSGGPMVVRGDKGEWVLVGLISWGMGCAAPKQPGVYTRISQFTDWIQGVMTY